MVYQIEHHTLLFGTFLVKTLIFIEVRYLGGKLSEKYVSSTPSSEKNMSSTLKIFVDQLKQGKIEKIDQTLSSSFLDVREPDLTFGPEVIVKGEAYIAEDELVLHLNISAQAIIPCSICNEPVFIPIEIKGFYHIEPLENISSGIFDSMDVIRENLLLETPAFAECANGHCPQRQTIEKYLKKEILSHEEKSKEEGYHPFSDLS